MLYRQKSSTAKSQRQKNIWWFGLQSRFIAAGGVTKTSPAPPQNQAILNISNPACLKIHQYLYIHLYKVTDQYIYQGDCDVP